MKDTDVCLLETTLMMFIMFLITIREGSEVRVVEKRMVSVAPRKFLCSGSEILIWYKVWPGMWVFSFFWKKHWSKGAHMAENNSRYRNHDENVPPSISFTRFDFMAGHATGARGKHSSGNFDPIC
jgi:hypothetical protein